MCLARDDVVSNHIRKHGEWHDCGRFVAIWQALNGPRDLHVGGYLALNGDPEGVLLEIGANIGACTIELLLRTKARIIALEPSPINLYYLTRSIKLAALSYPDILRRVVVLPIGAADVSAVVQLSAQKGNLGNTVAGKLSCGLASGGKDPNCRSRSVANASLLPLDQIFPNGLGDVRMIKLDVQGYECKVLQGAAQTIARAQRLSALVTEVDPTLLRAQCCGRRWLTLHLLRMYHIPRSRLAWNVTCTRTYRDHVQVTCVARHRATCRACRVCPGVYLARRVGCLGSERSPLSNWRPACASA